MEYKYQTARQYVKANQVSFDKTPLYVSKLLDIDDAHIYRARDGDYTLTFVQALRDEKMIPPPRKRERFSGDTPLADVIAAEARRCEITNGDLLELMWNYWMYFDDEEMPDDDQRTD